MDVKFSENYNTLLKQAKSMQNLINTYKSTIKFYSNKDYSLSKSRLDLLSKNLESEKEMNAKLTGEIEALEKQLLAMRNCKNCQKLSGNCWLDKAYHNECVTIS